MADLPNVSQGQPHVQAHNDERAKINAVANLSDEDFKSALDGEYSPLDHTHTAADVGAIPSGEVGSFEVVTQAEMDALIAGSSTVATRVYVVQD
jgi:hypothetical protein